jgi:hypothetical protein
VSGPAVPRTMRSTRTSPTAFAVRVKRSFRPRPAGVVSSELRPSRQ